MSSPAIAFIFIIRNEFKISFLLIYKMDQEKNLNLKLVEEEIIWNRFFVMAGSLSIHIFISNAILSNSKANKIIESSFLQDIFLIHQFSQLSRIFLFYHLLFQSFYSFIFHFSIGILLKSYGYLSF